MVSYSGPGVSGSNFDATVAGAGTHTITYTYTDINGCINSATNTIVVNDLPAVTFPGTLATQCITSTTYALTGGAPAGGTYSGPGVVGTNFNASIAGAGTHTLTYTYSDINGCTNTATNSITVNALPAAPIIGTIIQPTCSDPAGSIPLSGLPAAGTWTLTRNPGGITTTGTGTTTTVPGLLSGTYTFTVTDASATCTSPSSANAVIDLQPETPVVADQTTSILSGTAFTVIPSAVPVGTTYTWTAPVYTGTVSGGSAQAVPQSDISGSLTGTGTATYTVTPVSGACTGAAFTVTVTVTSICTPVTIGIQPSNNSMCVTTGNASFTVVANGTAPFTYQWEYNNGGTWAAVVNGTPAGAAYTNASTATLDISGITAAASYQYRVYVTNCAASNATSNPATLTVNQVPATPTASNNGPLCVGSTLNLTTPAVVGAIYTWTGPNSFSSALQNPGIAGITLSDAGTYNVTITLNGCESTSGSTTVVVNPVPGVTDQTTSIYQVVHSQ